MPPPRFVTCSLCGKGFGSASIGIHIPQCYDKALKRWQLDPIGPRPVMPAVPGKGRRSGPGNSDMPVGTGTTAARSLKASNVGGGFIGEEAPTNVNLHPCAKCGRNFNFDRITYHESVCKGDRKRPVFNSTAQRMPEEALVVGGGGGYGYVGGPRAPSRRGRKGPAAPPRRDIHAAPPSKWRQEHNEFISAIRAARAAESDSKAMWGAPSGGGGGGRWDDAPAPRAAPAKRRVPPLMTKQDRCHKDNIATGGRVARAQAQASAMRTAGSGPQAPGGKRVPPSRAFGGGGDRFAGYGPGGATGAAGGGGGGGNYRILNDNTSSLGMMQAFGRA